MPWSPNPIQLTRQSVGWTTTPTPAAVGNAPGWRAGIRELARAYSLSEAQAILVVKTVAAGLGISDAEALALVTLNAPAASVSSASAGAVEHVLGVVGVASSTSSASALIAAQLVAAATGASVAAATLLMRIVAAALSASSASAGAAFPAQSPAPTQYDSPGTYNYSIPYWCRFIDVVLVGGGAGGNGGSAAGATGHGGFAGVWASITLERGVHIPWTAAVIAIVVGVGGTAGAGGVVGALGGTGGTSSASADGWAGISAAGGTARPLVGLLHRPGDGPGNHVHNGITYVGGAESLNGAAGNPPGGAGSGGVGGIFSGATGGAGAPGRAWLRAYQ
ncbi:hypothetical protein SEA_MITTI_29 [Mycobacterium phage Mitti]|uniref:Glycine-rich domain-containing protein n=1 Tax=Mycobacterium phage Mitti TaxID=1917488 RepID=A0A1J0MDB7_9CAUD|nr:hypothetical protein SEA_MITTI_29 [Mycobacterium phage Mitti]